MREALLDLVGVLGFGLLVGGAGLFDHRIGMMLMGAAMLTIAITGARRWRA